MVAGRAIACTPPVRVMARLSRAGVSSTLMRTADRLGRDDWESILHAPLHAYVHVGGADAPLMEAQFRRLTDEIAAGREAFADGSLGQLMVVGLAENLDPLWAGFHAAGRSPRNGLSRARKALRKADDAESEAIRDWIVALAAHVAEASRTLGTDAVSPAETEALRDVAAWLDRPLPRANRGPR